LPANDEKSAEEHGNLHSDDEHEPLDVAGHVRRHVAIETPQLSHRALTIYTWSDMTESMFSSSLDTSRQVMSHIYLFIYLFGNKVTKDN